MSKPKKIELQEPELELGNGIGYALSDRTFIEKGWTKLPTEKIVRKMNVYRMRPSHPEFDWFAHNQHRGNMTYDTGEKLAEFDENGRGRLYYRNGRLALHYYDAEEPNVQQRYVIYSSGEPDERGRTYPVGVLAIFDCLGNGVVFDHTGKIRVKYNQTEGVIMDRSIGPISRWKWHILNDPPLLQQVMIDTDLVYKDPEIEKMVDEKKTLNPTNPEVLEIELHNFNKDKEKIASQTFTPIQIKMTALKINKCFSLKIVEQATIFLIFREKSANIKLNVGLILDHKDLVDTDIAEVGEVSNSLQRIPPKTNSLAGLQKSIEYAQRYERLRLDRKCRLFGPVLPVSSADQLTAAASKRLQQISLKILTPSVSGSEYCSCMKPVTDNVYYNTRLI